MSIQLVKGSKMDLDQRSGWKEPVPNGNYYIKFIQPDEDEKLLLQACLDIIRD